MTRGVIVNTGVFASKDEIEECRRWAREVRDTPVVFVHGQWLHEAASEAFRAHLDALAVAHGLPEPGLLDGETNHYGMSKDGEFTQLGRAGDGGAP